MSILMPLDTIPQSNIPDPNKIASETIAKLVESYGEKIFNYIKGKYSDWKIKNEIDYLEAYETYLKNAFDKYSKVKTLLYRREPVYLYSFYECLGLRTDNGKYIDTNSINNVLDHNHKIIIAGTGGIGKTTMMKHFFINTIYQSRRIPIFIELRGIKETETVKECMFRNINNLGFNLEEKYFEYSLETGCYIILFDGYDEIQSGHSIKVANEIKELTVKYHDNFYIISSRPTDAFIGWQDFSELRAMGLSKKQAISFISKLDYNIEIKEKFLSNLKETLFDSHNTFTSNPLLLTIMLMTYEEHATIPEQLHVFYEQAFITLFNRHDATKGGYQREIKSLLSYEDFKNAFAFFCFRGFFHGKYEFAANELYDYFNKCKNVINVKFDIKNYIDDLINVVCMLVQDGLIYQFIHRSFQEYFAALYVQKLTDDEQRKIIPAWIKSGQGDFKGGFLKILSDVEPKRFNSNIMIPLLQELQIEYNKQKEAEKGLWVVKKKFDSEAIILDETGDDYIPESSDNPDIDFADLDQNEYDMINDIANYQPIDLFDINEDLDDTYNIENITLAWHVTRNYIYKLIEEVKRRGKINVKMEPSELARTNDKKLMEFLLRKYHVDQPFKIDEICYSEIHDELCHYCRWYKEEFECAMQYLQELISDLNIKNTEWISLIDEL